MRYFVDCEFTKFNGKLMSFAIVSEKGHELYMARPKSELDLLKPDMHPFVTNVVLPAIDVAGASPKVINLNGWIPELANWLRVMGAIDKEYIFCADWPEDIKHLMTLMITGPGTMIGLPNFSCEIYRDVQSYPTQLEGAVAHNALWDARAIKHKLLGA